MALNKFDDNHDGMISKNEFIKMISNPPWDQLLPPNVQAKMHTSLMDQNTDTAEQRKATSLPHSSLTAPSSSCRCVLNEVMSLIFRAAHDITRRCHVCPPSFHVNSNGSLNMSLPEPPGCVHPFEYSQLSLDIISTPPPLSPSYASGLICTPLSPKVRDEIFRDAAIAAAAKGVIKSCKELFMEVDGNGDGQLNEAELECLVQMVHLRIAAGDAPIPAGDLRLQVTCSRMPN